MTLVALVPLFAVLWMLIWRGGKKLSAGVVYPTASAAPWKQGGGFGNAIVGTLIMVGTGRADHRSAAAS